MPGRATAVNKGGANVAPGQTSCLYQRMQSRRDEPISGWFSGIICDFYYKWCDKLMLLAILR
jgi:hypothetical protein